MTTVARAGTPRAPSGAADRPGRSEAALTRFRATPTLEPMQGQDSIPEAQLLAVVEVDKGDRVTCQAKGCGHSVYKRIHVVREGVALHVYGSDCFDKLFGGITSMGTPRYGTGDGRRLTEDERRMLIDNTARLIERFEAEHFEALESAARARSEREAYEREALALVREAERRAANALVERQLAAQQEAARRAGLEEVAKRDVREKYGVDPELAGWRGLVMARLSELLRASKG